MLEELDQQIMSPREHEAISQSDDAQVKTSDIESSDKDLPVLPLTMENVQRHEEYQRYRTYRSCLRYMYRTSCVFAVTNISSIETCTCSR